MAPLCGRSRSGLRYSARIARRGTGFYSEADLADIIVRLKRFMRADAARCNRASAVASPLPQASVRVAYAAPVVSSPAPPAIPPDVVTRGEWASAIAAQAAQTAEVLSVLRAMVPSASRALLRAGSVTSLSRSASFAPPPFPPAAPAGPTAGSAGGDRRKSKPTSGQPRPDDLRSGGSRGGSDGQSTQRSGRSHGDSDSGSHGLCRRCSTPLPPPGPYHTKMLRNQRPGWGPRRFCPRCSTTRKPHFAALAGVAAPTAISRNVIGDTSRAGRLSVTLGPASTDAGFPGSDPWTRLRAAHATGFAVDTPAARLRVAQAAATLSAHDHELFAHIAALEHWMCCSRPRR
jgi:hypothetical protein